MSKLLGLIIGVVVLAVMFSEPAEPVASTPEQAHTIRANKMIRIAAKAWQRGDSVAECNAIATTISEELWVSANHENAARQRLAVNCLPAGQ